MLDNLKATLDKTGIPFKHFAWAHRPSVDTYGVYYEDGADHLYADDSVLQQMVDGVIDVYTTDDSGAAKNAVENALSADGVSWRFDSAEYDDDTGYLQYSWSFEVLK